MSTAHRLRALDKTDRSVSTKPSEDGTDGTFAHGLVQRRAPFLAGNPVRSEYSIKLLSSAFLPRLLLGYVRRDAGARTQNQLWAFANLAVRRLLKFVVLLARSHSANDRAPRSSAGRLQHPVESSATIALPDGLSKGV